LTRGPGPCGRTQVARLPAPPSRLQLPVQSPSMKILVTGGAGFIGSHVADAYVAAGHEVAVLDNLSTGREENVNAQAALHRVDIRDLAKVNDAIASFKPDGVDHPIRPLSPYGTSKFAFEQYLGTFERTFHLNYTVLRYANVYGARQDFFAEEGRVVAIFAGRMIEGRPVTIDGDGNQSRDML